ARLSPGPGFHPTNALRYYTQRVITPAVLRRAVSRGIAALVRSTHGGGRDWPADPAFSEISANLDRTGFAMLDSVPLSTIDEMRVFFHASEVMGPKNRLMP